MVCSRGESLTTHRNQTKLFKAVAAAVVVSASLIPIQPAEAKKVYSKEEWYECQKEIHVHKACSLVPNSENQSRSNGGRPSFSTESWGNDCPPGTRHYRTKGLFGLGARDIGCMTAYEAESLRRQNYHNFQNNLNRNRMRNCTTNFIGSTAYTNCY